MNDISPGLRARVLLEKHGFQPTHALGQNFLLDERLLSHLIDLAGVAEEDDVLEIGPGPGLMTRLLSQRVRSVTAVELDRRLKPVLSSMLEGCENVRVVYADALKADLCALSAPGARVVANLPYYITADVISRLLLRGPGYKSVAVMVQKEAAERMLSLPGDKQWCHLAAIVRYFGKVQILEEIPPEAFQPSPHVVSAFLRIDLYDPRPVRPNDEALFLRVLSAAFAMRRKTLQNNLRAAFPLSAQAAAEAIERAGLPERVRGEAVPLEGLARLADALGEMLKSE